ncbi:hypothetical protein [Hymenobacter volaticus]|uniref:Uncharacterized protein n=1 Tax=Hymenobacter volaticus TaxID=2932254 RepID=A0ABY4G2G0_9BACT|nr:hypothetical protein [Hymenobacter volaticus]UOQ65065.1 hypothetical protein MUN86_16020 [Hymenobacter volaticus]
MDDYFGLEIPPGWKTGVEEVSNNVYKVELRNTNEQVAGDTSHDLKASLEKCIQAALEIDVQMKHLSKGIARARGEY